MLFSAASLFSFQGTTPILFQELVVGSSRLELPTSRLSGARSNLLSYEPIQMRTSFGLPSGYLYGDDGIRTHDPLLAGQVLSQLSYTPMVSPSSFAMSSFLQAHSKLNNIHFRLLSGWT